MRLLGRARDDERGADLVEVAVVVPLLLLLVLGAVDMGRVFHSFITILNASREGARYGSRFPDDYSGIRSATKQEAHGSSVLLYDSDITIEPEGSAPARAGDPIRVWIEYGFQTLMGGMIGMETITLRSMAEMVVFDEG